MLTLNEQGQVIAATNATPTSLFGFSPHDVIGAPLSAFVNVFEEWQRQGKDVISLLALLVTHEQVCPDKVLDLVAKLKDLDAGCLLLSCMHVVRMSLQYVRAMTALRTYGVPAAGACWVMLESWSACPQAAVYSGKCSECKGMPLCIVM